MLQLSATNSDASLIQADSQYTVVVYYLGFGRTMYTTVCNSRIEIREPDSGLLRSFHEIFALPLTSLLLSQSLREKQQQPMQHAACTLVWSESSYLSTAAAAFSACCAAASASASHFFSLTSRTQTEQQQLSRRVGYSWFGCFEQEANPHRYYDYK